MNPFARWRAPRSRRSGLSRAGDVAARDIALPTIAGDRPFSSGTRPVIRWVKGNGLDDVVTRAAIGQATRIFGDTVDYCLCTNDIAPERARSILAWASQPVEWWPVSADDNPDLAGRLREAGCEPGSYGYWWKWFPERVRPAGPEWILDGDMVIVGQPPWFADWAAGRDVCRISRDDSMVHPDMYGSYADLVDRRTGIYSGLASLPPHDTYMDAFVNVLDRRPLARPHDGRRDMCEQGVVALAFGEKGAETFPLAEFPFARAFDPGLDFGTSGDRGVAWGYHFGHAFRMANPHFERMVADGVVFARDEPSVTERFTWLGNFGQWGVPGWSLTDTCTRFILDAVEQSGAREVLELGTARGRMSAMLCTLGMDVTTVDHVDRGARVNLSGLGATTVVADALDYLVRCRRRFPVIVVDVHDNSESVWRRLLPVLTDVVDDGGRIAISNARLWKIPEWREETGVAWVLRNLPPSLRIESSFEDAPGVVILRRD